MRRPSAGRSSSTPTTRVPSSASPSSSPSGVTATKPSPFLPASRSRPRHGGWRPLPGSVRNRRATATWSIDSTSCSTGSRTTWTPASSSSTFSSSSGPTTPARPVTAGRSPPASTELRFRRDADHWLWIGGPVPPGANGITIGPVVSLRKAAAGDQHLLRHEAVHVRQWRELGFFGFLPPYLGAYFRWRLRGYGHWG